MTGLSAPCEFAACRISLLQRMAGSTGRVAAWSANDQCPVWAVFRYEGERQNLTAVLNSAS